MDTQEPALDPWALWTVSMFQVTGYTDLPGLCMNSTYYQPALTQVCGALAGPQSCLYHLWGSEINPQNLPEASALNW